MNVHPFSTIFSGKGFKGSTHDYSFFKERYTEFLPFLKKNPHDFQLLENDNHVSWTIMGDKGYIGPDSSVPDLRKITPFKGKKNQRPKKI